MSLGSGAKGRPLHFLSFTSRFVVYKLWRCRRFRSFRHAPLQTSRLDTQLATNCQSTNMSSVTSPQRSDNDGPRPYLVISAHNPGIRYLAYLSDGRRVVTGSKGIVKIWNLENGGQEGTSMKHGTGTYELAVTGMERRSSPVTGKGASKCGTSNHAKLSKNGLT